MLLFMPIRLFWAGNLKYEEDPRNTRPSWKQCDQNRPPSGPCSQNSIERNPRPLLKESKHRVEIKLIEKNKAEDPELLHTIQPQSCSSGLNNLAGKAVSALSNCISYIFPPSGIQETAAKHTEDRLTEDMVKGPNSGKTRNESNEIFQRVDQGNETAKSQPRFIQQARNINNGGNHGHMDDLIEKFKTETLNADDETFDYLFNELKKELEGLSCECLNTEATGIKTDKDLHFEDDQDIQHSKNAADIEKYSRDYTANREDYLTKNELKEMFADLKLLLEKNFCACNKIYTDLNLNKTNKDSTNIGNITPYLRDECTCNKINCKKENSKSKSENDVNAIRGNTEDNIPNGLIDFYSRITSKLDEISQQCLSNKSRKSTERKSSTNARNQINVESSNHSVIVDGSLTTNSSINTNDPNSPLQSQVSLHGPHSSSVEQEEKKNLLIQQKNRVVDENRMDAVYEVEKTLSHARICENCIPLDEFVNLANELKEALYTSSCKCSKSSTEHNHPKERSNEPETANPDEEMEDEEIFPNLEKNAVHAILDDGESSNHITPELTLLQKVAEDPMNLSDLFTDQTGKLNSLIESPAASFYSAESSNDTKMKRKEEEVGVNTQCKCFSDQVVQTFGDIKASYGVICHGQLTLEEQDRSEVSDIQIRGEMSKDGNVEKVKVRIRLKEGKIDADSKNTVALVRQNEVEKSPRFIRSFANHVIRYETTNTEIDEPKVVKDGGLIKIFIPLEPHPAK